MSGKIPIKCAVCGKDAEVEPAYPSLRLICDECFKKLSDQNKKDNY